ncbi:hypothetical protein ACP4OV_005442 [Aristida adscensionis]
MSGSGSGSGSTAEAAPEQDYHGGGGGGGGGRRCAACKYLRRRCADGCVLAPYFPASQPQRYADVHAVFGTSNVTRLLQSLPVQERGAAADAMAAEAQWRVRDPVYGCTGVISRLQEEIRAAQRELARTRAQLAVQVQVHGGAPAPAPAQAQHCYSFAPPPRQGTTAAAATQQLAPPSQLLLFPPPPPAAAADPVVAHAGGCHRVVEHGEHEGEEDDDDDAPLMNPDEFLDLDNL